MMKFSLRRSVIRSITQIVFKKSFAFLFRENKRYRNFRDAYHRPGKRARRLRCNDDELYIIYIVQERVVARFHQETNQKDVPGSAPPINCCRHIPPQPPRLRVSAELPPVTHRERTLIN